MLKQIVIILLVLHALDCGSIEDKLFSYRLALIDAYRATAKGDDDMFMYAMISCQEIIRELPHDIRQYYTLLTYNKLREWKYSHAYTGHVMTEVHNSEEFRHIGNSSFINTVNNQCMSMVRCK